MSELCDDSVIVKIPDGHKEFTAAAARGISRKHGLEKQKKDGFHKPGKLSDTAFQCCESLQLALQR